MLNERCICGQALQEIYRLANGGAYIAECAGCGKRYDELAFWNLKQYHSTLR